MEIFLVMFALGLIWMAVRHQSNSRRVAGKGAKQCPSCREHVKAAATVCRYCQRDVPEAPQAARTQRINPTTIWLAALILVAMLALNALAPS
jgi:hypothetical protein